MNIKLNVKLLFYEHENIITYKKYQFYYNKFQHQLKCKHYKRNVLLKSNYVNNEEVPKFLEKQ